MVVDYEAAWVELQAIVAAKSQHGQRDLLAKMAELASEHRVPAGELSRLLRLYSVEVGRRPVSANTVRDEAERLAAGFGSVGDDDLPGHHDLGGHDGDGSSSRGAGVPAGVR